MLWLKWNKNGQHFQRIEIRGKRDRKVPILLTPEMLASMELLLKNQNRCGVPDENQYVCKTRSRNTLQRIRFHPNVYQWMWGKKLSSTKLRKQVSTLSKVLNLKDTEMDQLADFLGHDIRVHRKIYRLPEGTLQLAKISKVLLALEQGRMSEFKGKNLEEIGIGPNGKCVLKLEQVVFCVEVVYACLGWLLMRSNWILGVKNGNVKRRLCALSD